MDAIKFLEKIRTMDDEINDMLDERHRLLSVAMDISPKPMDGMPFDDRGTVAQKMQDAITAVVDLERKINAKIDMFIDHKKQALQMLRSLPPLERDVMIRHYFKYETWTYIADAKGYSRMQLWRIRQKAYHNILG